MILYQRSRRPIYHPSRVQAEGKQHVPPVTMIPQQLIVAGLAALAKDPQMIGRLCVYIGEMPNLEMKTQGGKIWWDDVANIQGWRMQRNKVFGNCRILNPHNVRKAWGSEEAMMSAFQRMLEAS